MLKTSEFWVWVCAGVWDPSLQMSSYSLRLTRQISTLVYGAEAAEKCKQLDVLAAFLNVMVLLCANVGVSGTQYTNVLFFASAKLARMHAVVLHPKPAGYSVRQAEVFLACQQTDESLDIIASELEKHRQWCNGMRPLLERYQANRFGSVCALGDLGALPS